MPKKGAHASAVVSHKFLPNPLKMDSSGNRETSSRSRADLGGGCRECAPPPPDDLRFSNTTGILQKKKTMWFIGVEVEQETSAPPPKKNPGSAPGYL